MNVAHHQELNLIQQLAIVGVADLDETVALRDLVHLLLDALQHLLVAAQLPLDVVHLPERLVQQLHQDVHLLLRRHDGLDVCLGSGGTEGGACISRVLIRLAVWNRDAWHLLGRAHPVENLQLPGELLGERLGIGDGELAHLHHALDVLLLAGAQLLVVVQSVLITAGDALAFSVWYRLWCRTQEGNASPRHRGDDRTANPGTQH